MHMGWVIFISTDSLDSVWSIEKSLLLSSDSGKIKNFIKNIQDLIYIYKIIFDEEYLANHPLLYIATPLLPNISIIVDVNFFIYRYETNNLNKKNIKIKF